MLKKNTFILGIAAVVFTASANVYAQITPEKKNEHTIGHFEASGVRLGMSFDLALDAISATKPAWAAAVSQARVQASRDCSTQGRSIIAVSRSVDGLATAMLDIRCDVDAKGQPSVRELEIKTLISRGMTNEVIKAAISARYGSPTSNSDSAGGFEWVWIAPDTLNPMAPQAETLTVRLESRPIDQTPSRLTLQISSLPSKTSAMASKTRITAADSLPF
jgi:hypothetical protein